jgi:hypothetical protein
MNQFETYIPFYFQYSLHLDRSHLPFEHSDKRNFVVSVVNIPNVLLIASLLSQVSYIYDIHILVMKSYYCYYTTVT